MRRLFSVIQAQEPHSVVLENGMMRVLTVILVLAAWCAGAATRYVTLTGTDSGAANSWGTSWRTIAYAAANATDGDTIQIGSGNFGEYVYVQTKSGLTFTSVSNATTCAFRVGTASNTFSGLILSNAQDMGVTWSATFRIEAAGHYTTITNCLITHTPSAMGTNMVFDPDADTIICTNVNFITAGFVTNGHAFWNGSSITSQMFANQHHGGTIKSITATQLGFDDGVITAETNGNAWAHIYFSPGDTHPGQYVIYGVPESSTGATNVSIINNRMTNVIGIPLVLQGYGWLVQGNDISNIGNTGISVMGSNHRVLSNYFHHSTLPIWYSKWEHDSGLVVHNNDTWDYVGGFIHTSGYSTTWNTNNVIAWNWFDDIDQNMGQLSTYGKASFYGRWYIKSNVFSRFYGNFSGGVNDIEITHNTFYRCAIGEGLTTVLTMGSGVSAPDLGTTNWLLSSNLFVNCGGHAQLGNEGYYGLSSAYGTITTNYNMVTGSEVTGWTNASGFSEANGINGGNPLFANEGDPLGPDGLPFTADDGLRPLTGSRASGLGALEAVAATGTAPVAHFGIANASGGFYWSEPVGSNYNTAWQAALPWQRTSPYRANDAPDPLPNIPQFVTFTATNSISGTWSTNNWIGIRDFVWDFGDGSRAIWTRWPDVSHTFLRTGAVTMTLTVTNTGGYTDTTTKRFMVNPSAASFTNHIHYVATTGSDATGTGSSASPWRTITNGIVQMAAGDYLAVLPGDYNELVNRSDTVNGTAAKPITIVGYDASPGSVYQRKDWWTWEGFEFSTTNYCTSDYVFGLAGLVNGITMRNNWWHDCGYESTLFAAPASGGKGGTNFTLVNNLMNDVGGGNTGLISFGGQTNITLDANIMKDTRRQGDGLQFDAWGVTVSRNDYLNLGYTNNNHTDIWQINGYNNIPKGQIVFRQNWIEQPAAMPNGNGIQITDMTSSFNDDWRYADPSYSNMVFFNNVFIYVGKFGSFHLDGTKFYNNLFYRVGTNESAAYVSGGSHGSCIGTDWRNNIFFQCGPNYGADNTIGWYDNGFGQTNITVTADYDYVCGTNYAAKRVPPPNNTTTRWGVTITNLGVVTIQEVYSVNGGNPLFSDAANGDYRLLTNSPLATAGTNLASVFTTDFFGQARGSTWTIGPFNTVSAISPPPIPPPTPPRTLRVQGKVNYRNGIRFQ